MEREVEIRDIKLVPRLKSLLSAQGCASFAEN